MRLLFDIQSLQSLSSTRGIGRYTRHFLQAHSELGFPHEVIFLLNDNFGNVSETWTELKKIYPSAQLCVMSLPSPTADSNADNHTRNEAAELIREWFISEINPDHVHIFSLFEGYGDAAVTSIGRLAVGFPVTVTFYDLIPLLNPNDYLSDNPPFQDHYNQKLRYLKLADGLLAISEFASKEVISGLGYPRNNVAVATLGPMQGRRSYESIGASPNNSVFELCSKPGFFLYVGGSDARKNLARLIQAWASLSLEQQISYPLVFAGWMSERDIDVFRAIATDFSADLSALIFLGHVSDEELEHLYRGCSVFVFPSWHEGFGLPALEAMAAGSAVIAANSSSLPEVVGMPEALFDPYDVDSIAHMLARAIEDEEFRARLLEHAPKQAAKFSWRNTASQGMSFFESFSKVTDRPESTPSVKTGSMEAWESGYQNRLQKFLELSVEYLKKIKNPKLLKATTKQIAIAIDGNERELNRYHARFSDQVTPWRVEGPFDTSYSLAIVNREFARGLALKGVDVHLHSTDGPGDFLPDTEFLKKNPDLLEMAHDSTDELKPRPAVISRLLYPPRVKDMQGAFNLLHLYGWEEGELPASWVYDFNRHLDGITTMSKFVSKVLVDNGVSVPQLPIGLGVDHWERIVPNKHFVLPEETKGFIFLHVSSCFPRKGVDVLLEAWGRAFEDKEEVSLIIKTFPNPHNEVHSLLSKAKQRFANFASVCVIDKDLSDGEMKALMEKCNAFVGPSRGEGFGLPLAEAMLSGLPVITTGYGGQMDFCDESTSWLVDFSFSRAKTHFKLTDSVWAEPDCDGLKNQLLAVSRATREERAMRARRGRQRLLNSFSWGGIARRVTNAAMAWKKVRVSPSLPRVAWISSWNTRCGIAGYSSHLLEMIELEFSIFASRLNAEEELYTPISPEDGPEVHRCWTSGRNDNLSELRQGLSHYAPDVVVIQFNFGFYDVSAISEFIRWLTQKHISVVVMLHSTSDSSGLSDTSLKMLGDAFSVCDRLLVHSVDDLNRMKEIGLVDNVTLFPHGVIECPKKSGLSDSFFNKKPLCSEGFQIASFGFLLPNKGLEELVDAICMLRAEGLDVQLNMLNAEYPLEVSRVLAITLKDKIAKAGVQSSVELDTIYYTDEECLERLSTVDLIVLPYQQTQESSSAAVRHAIASGAPVAVTPLRIFQNVEDATIRFPGTDVNALVDGIRNVIAWDSEQKKDYLSQAKQWREAHSYRIIAKRLEGMLCGLHRLKSQQTYRCGD